METIRNEQQRQQEQTAEAAIASSLDNLLKGDLKMLANSRFVTALPETARDLLLDNRVETADSLLMYLAIALQHQQPTIRDHAFRTLAATAEHLADIGQWDRFAKLLPALQQGLQSQDADTDSCRQAITAIGALTGHYLNREQYVSAYETTHFLQSLATAAGDGLGHAQRPAEEILRSLSTTPVLHQLLERYLDSEEHQEIAGKLLVKLGQESVHFLLQQLIDGDSPFERKRLLTLIKETGSPAISVLLEQLHKETPWFVLRNVIRLLGNIGNPALFPRVQPFIHHNDPRVQQEVINTAVKIGGDQLRDFLLHALQTADDSLKIKVISHVATNHDERFIRPLTNLLENTKPFLGKNKNDLQLSICKTLGAIGSKRSTASLNRVAHSKNVLGLIGYSDEVRQAALDALHQIKRTSSAQHHPAYPEPPTAEKASNRQAVAPTAESPPITAEETIVPLVEQGKQEQVKEQLFDLMDAVFHCGDLDDEQKSTVREEDLEAWVELTDRLGTLEFTTLCDAFTERRYQSEETIVSQGDKNDSLFFINQGSVKVSHMVGAKDLFITSLSRGQLAGENFFTPSLWTVTLTSLTPSRLYVLPQATLATWQKQFPALRATLHEYYRAYNNIGSMLKKKGLDRRKDERFMLSRKIRVQPISNLDTPIGQEFLAETTDISLGGLAFLLRIARQENVRLLLGRRMQIVLPVGGKIGHLLFRGLVIGIQPYQQRSGAFSVHLRFDHCVDRQELQAILG
jgi:HEAT repeat protein/CRP-like cAMP-binding protein